MFRKTLVDSDLLLSKSFWWGHVWKPYRNLSEEVRVLRDLEADAIKKAGELTHSRIVAESNVKMDVTVLTHQLLTNSTAHFEFPTEPSILEMREGMKYQHNKQDNKQGASSNKGGGQQGSQHKSGSQSGGERSDNKQQQSNQQAQDKGNQTHRKGHGTVSLFDLITKGKISLHQFSGIVYKIGAERIAKYR